VLTPFTQPQTEDRESTAESEAQQLSSDKDTPSDFASGTEKEDGASPRTTHLKPVTVPRPLYTVPPTVLHDGKLFRKVG
jgi:hypothetical protein